MQDLQPNKMNIKPEQTDRAEKNTREKKNTNRREKEKNFMKKSNVLKSSTGMRVYLVLNETVQLTYIKYYM